MTWESKIDKELIPSHINNSGNLYIPIYIGRGLAKVVIDEEGGIYITITPGSIYSRYVSIGKERVKEIFSGIEKTTYPVVLQREGNSKLSGVKIFKLLFKEGD